MSAFPSINTTGVITQFPYSEEDEWLVAATSLESGATYTKPYSPRLRRFVVQYPSITQAEVEVLEDFFISMRGRLGEFDFTDDDNVVWHHTRFDVDRMQVVYEQPNSYSVSFNLSSEAA